MFLLLINSVDFTQEYVRLPRINNRHEKVPTFFFHNNLSESNSYVAGIEQITISTMSIEVT